MTRSEAQAEILRRLVIYLQKYKSLGYGWALRESKYILLKYHSGELSREKLLQKITQDEDGNLLSEPKRFDQWLKYGGFAAINEGRMWTRECREYQTQRQQAEQILKDYETINKTTSN